MLKKVNQFWKKFLQDLGFDEDVKNFVKKIKPPWKYIWLILFFTLLLNFTTVIQPLMLAKLFELINSEKSIWLLNLIVLGGILLFLIRGVSQYFQGYLLAKASQEVLTEKRKEFIEIVFKQPVYVLERNHSGHLVSVVISNIAVIVSDLPGLIIGYINSIITLIFSLSWIFYKDVTLGLMTIFTLPALTFVLKHFFKKVENIAELIQQKISHLITGMNEVFRYMRVVKVFNREEFEKQRVFKLIDEYKNLQLRLARISMLQKPAAEFVASLSLIVITWYSGYLVIKGVLKPFDVIAYWGYVAISVSPITNLSASLFNTRVIFGFIKEFMKTLSSLNINEFDNSLYEYNRDIVFRGKITFDSVSFGYDENKILDKVSFTIYPGQKVAIIGKSGIGKSTLISLLVKFYKPIEGKIYIDDIDIEKINPNVLRKNISILTQEIYLFNDSIFKNIEYSKQGASMDEIVEACKKAEIHDEIMSKKEGYNYVVMEDGKGLSGGQRQRIALARLFLKDSPIVILDEPTSALDKINTEKIVKSIFTYFKDKTVIIISHTIDVIKEVDRVFTIQDGKIIEQDKSLLQSKS